jgi:GTP cyclohydrolase II
MRYCRSLSLFEKMERVVMDPHVVLTSHTAHKSGRFIEIDWGAADPAARGPVVGTISDKADRNAIGSHGGSYSIYRALSIAQGVFPLDHRPDLTDTEPTTAIEPQPSWARSEAIVSLDPWGASIKRYFSSYLEDGYNVQPTIAVTQAHLQLHEISEAIDQGRLEVDDQFVRSQGDVAVTKVAIDPVWHLPSMAKRFGIEEPDLRRVLYMETGGMYPEMVTRPDLEVLLPPIGSTTAYIFGNPADLANPDVELTLRVHDECNGSDVFGSDICTCRPYLTWAIEDAARTAQRGGVGLVVYYRKEGRALGEVTKFMVYNARKRQDGGDMASTYFERTECVAGVQDARFQELMPDVLHYFGITKIHNLHSMSNMKYDAIVGSGIEIVNRLSLPDELVPADAQVEIEAKKAAGYFTEDEIVDDLDTVVGRTLDE